MWLEHRSASESSSRCHPYLCSLYSKCLLSGSSNIFFLSLVLSNLLMTYLGIVSFIFPILGVHWVSWNQGFAKAKFGKISAITSSTPFFPSLQLSLLLQGLRIRLVRLPGAAPGLPDALLRFCLSFCVFHFGHLSSSLISPSTTSDLQRSHCLRYQLQLGEAENFTTIKD